MIGATTTRTMTTTTTTNTSTTHRPSPPASPAALPGTRTLAPLLAGHRAPSPPWRRPCCRQRRGRRRRRQQQQQRRRRRGRSTSAALWPPTSACRTLRTAVLLNATIQTTLRTTLAFPSYCSLARATGRVRCLWRASPRRCHSCCCRARARCASSCRSCCRRGRCDSHAHSLTSSSSRSRSHSHAHPHSSHLSQHTPPAGTRTGHDYCRPPTPTVLLTSWRQG